MTTSDRSGRLQARLVRLRQNGRIFRLAAFDAGTAEGRSDERFRRLTLSAVTSAAAKGIALITTAVSVPLTLGYLGSERFGVWMTLSAVVALLGFSDLGIGNSLLNKVAHASGRDDLTTIRTNLASGIVMLLAVSVGSGVLFAAVYQIIPWARVFNIGSPVAVGEVGPAAAALVACFLIGMPAGAFQQVRFGLQQGYVNSIFVGVGNLAGLALVIWAIQMRLGLPWLVLAMAGAPVVATLANGIVLLVQSPWLRLTRHDVNVATAVSLLRVGLSFLMLQLAIAVAFTSDSIILAAILGPSAVSNYTVVSKLFLIPTLVVGFALGPLWPAYREGLSRGDFQWVHRTFRRSIRLSLTVGGLLSVALVLLGLPIIAVWAGTSVQPSFGLVLAIGVWTTLSAVGTAVAMLLNGAQILRFQVVTALLMAASNILLSVLLTYQIGAAGVVWGSVIAFTVCSLVPLTVYAFRLVARLELQGKASGVL